MWGIINLRTLSVRGMGLSLVALAAVLLLMIGCASEKLREPWVEPFDTAGEWQLDSDATAELEVADGVLSIHVLLPQQVAWAYVERTFADFRLRVEATPVGGPLDNEYGVLIRMRENEQFYAFSISADGYARVTRYDLAAADAEHVCTPLPSDSDWTLTPAVQQGEATNVLVVEAQGPQFKFWVNDELVADVEDDALSRGGLGLYAGAFSEPGVHVNFDNLRVEPLSASQ
jgi:hypothetical protein